MIYLITYDLNKPGNDYAPIYRVLEQFTYIRDSRLDSVWFISTSFTTEQVYNHIAPVLDANDRLFISQVKAGEYFGYMHGDIWKWINSHLEIRHF